MGGTLLRPCRAEPDESLTGAANLVGGNCRETRKQKGSSAARTTGDPTLRSWTGSGAGPRGAARFPPGPAPLQWRPAMSAHSISVARTP